MGVAEVMCGLSWDSESLRGAGRPEAIPVSPRLMQFDQAFAVVFEAEYPRLFRYMDRLSGEPDLAADLAQEAFIRLHRRGAMPERPGLWLLTVAMNLFRNERSTAARRRRLLTRWRPAAADPVVPATADSHLGEQSHHVRAALRQLSSRDQEMLLLRAEGYSYKEIASLLGLNEPSVGTLLARAKRAFRQAYEKSYAP
jgi:RNA polymerase sigma-70 factor (ECF subfamily)